MVNGDESIEEIPFPIDNPPFACDDGHDLHSPMDFTSVNDFLKKASTAKDEERKAIDGRLAPYLDDPSLIGVSPEIADTIEACLEQYGDEALKQIGLFCIGKWLRVHGGIMEDYRSTNSWDEAMVVMTDMTRISAALQSLGAIGSFGGDDDWRAMLREVVTQVVMEKIEEGNSFASFFSALDND